MRLLTEASGPCWLVAMSFSSSPCGAVHRTAHDRLVSLRTSGQRENKRGKEMKDKLDMLLKLMCMIFAFILLFWICALNASNNFDLPLRRTPVITLISGVPITLIIFSKY